MRSYEKISMVGQKMLQKREEFNRVYGYLILGPTSGTATAQLA
jgi:hypothetical protein